MKLSINTGRLFSGTSVLLSVAAIAAPAFAASGALDPWQQNLSARAKYAQVTDPWALNLFARQTHRDVEYTPPAPSAAGKAGVTNGFHWSDAGIGAAGAFGVVLLAAGTAIALRKSGGLAHIHR